MIITKTAQLKNFITSSKQKKKKTNFFLPSPFSAFSLWELQHRRSGVIIWKKVPRNLCSYTMQRLGSICCPLKTILLVPLLESRNNVRVKKLKKMKIDIIVNWDSVCMRLCMKVLMMLQIQTLSTYCVHTAFINLWYTSGFLPLHFWKHRLLSILSLTSKSKHLMLGDGSYSYRDKRKIFVIVLQPQKRYCMSELMSISSNNPQWGKR